ncbi:MAG: hypothetical protein SFW64_05680 [Alphaproteobacteria bacterium]|nr:hypothetical protein [Alphaproteobacteria bacterium]
MNKLFATSLVCLLGTASLLPTVAWADAGTEELRKELEATRSALRDMQQRYESQIGTLEKRLNAVEAQKAASPVPAASPPVAATAAASAEPGASVEQRLRTLEREQTLTRGELTTAQSDLYGSGAKEYGFSAVVNGGFAEFSRSADATLPGFGLAGGRRPEGFNADGTFLNFLGNVNEDFNAVFLGVYTKDDAFDVPMAFVHAKSLPYGFNATFGRKPLGIGLMNVTLPYQDAYADRPLPYRAFLGGNYYDDGLEVRWDHDVTPKTYVELGTGAFRGSRFPAAGSANDGKGSYEGFANIGDALSGDYRWRLNASYLLAKDNGLVVGADTFHGDSSLIIAGGQLEVPFGEGFQNNVLQLQGEYFHRNLDGRVVSIADDLNSNQDGLYAQANYKFFNDYRIGYRYAWIEADNPGAAFAATSFNPAGENAQAHTVVLDYIVTPSSYLRGQYTRDKTGADDDNEYLLQYVMQFGSF